MSLKSELMEVRNYPGGDVMLYTDRVVVHLDPNASKEQHEEVELEAKYTAALATKPVPVEVNTYF